MVCLFFRLRSSKPGAVLKNSNMDLKTQEILNKIIENEGGYVNDPDDPGGETKFGISKRQYPDLDIKNLTEDDAIEIYYRDYMRPLNLEGIASANDKLQILDMAINAGKETAVRLAQAIIGVKVDGIIGKNTSGAINGTKNFFSKYQTARISYYEGLIIKNSDLEKFRDGWFRRVYKTYVT